MEVIFKLFLTTRNFAMHHWYKQFILQMLCRDKEADPCSLQSLRKCSGMRRGCDIFSTLSFPTLRSLKHIQSHFPRHRALTQFLEELNGFTCHEKTLKYCNMASRENPSRYSTFIKQEKTKASVQMCWFLLFIYCIT